MRGAQHAYCITTAALRARDWEALAPLLAPACLAAMRLALDGDRASHRAESEARVISCRLRRALLAEPYDGRAEMHVCFSTDSKNGPQQSTWVFEGEVQSPPEATGGAWMPAGPTIWAPSAASSDLADAAAEEAAAAGPARGKVDWALPTDWRVSAIDPLEACV